MAQGFHWRTSARPAIAAPILSGRACSLTQFGRIQIADEGIKATLPLGSTAYKTKISAKGERLIWLDARVVDRLTALRGPVESYSDVILRLAARSDISH